MPFQGFLLPPVSLVLLIPGKPYRVFDLARDAKDYTIFINLFFVYNRQASYIQARQRRRFLRPQAIASSGSSIPSNSTPT